MKIKLSKDVEKIFKRKEKEKQDAVEVNFKNIAMYFVIVCMLFVTIFSLFLSYKTYKNIGKENYTEYVEETIAENVETVDKEEEERRKIEEEKLKLEEEKKKKRELEEIKRKEEIAKKEAEKLSFTYPLLGEITRKYCKDNVCYYETLDVWKTHDGIDIKAEEGKEIFAVESGKVIAVKNDPLYGKIIVIDHGKGYKSIYCNLQEEVFVKEGDAVKKEAIIAKVGTTAVCEKKEGPHLHFEVTKDSKYIDPCDVIDFKDI